MGQGSPAEQGQLTVIENIGLQDKDTDLLLVRS